MNVSIIQISALYATERLSLSLKASMMMSLVAHTSVLKKLGLCLVVSHALSGCLVWARSKQRCSGTKDILQASSGVACSMLTNAAQLVKVMRISSMSETDQLQYTNGWKQQKETHAFAFSCVYQLNHVKGKIDWP